MTGAYARILAALYRGIAVAVLVLTILALARIWWR